MNKYQPGILVPVPRLAHYLTFTLRPDTDPVSGLQSLIKIVDGKQIVAGIGDSLIQVLGTK